MMYKREVLGKGKKEQLYLNNHELFLFLSIDNSVVVLLITGVTFGSLLELEGQD